MRALRLSVVVAVIAAALSGGAAPAHAQLALRGNYWRDRNTRVLAPEAEVRKELPTGTTLSGGYLLDAITSASAAAGGLSDTAFTELRNQVTVGAAQRIGPATVGASYRYSTESDYWAHVGGVSAAVDLFQKNTTVAASFFYSRSDVAARSGPKSYNPVGHLEARFFMASASQVLSRHLVVDGVYELSDEGDADEKDCDPRDRGCTQSFLGNPYRTVLVGGSPRREQVPRGRTRHALTGQLRGNLLIGPRPLRYIGAAARYRFYMDNWGVVSHAPELRTWLAIGPVELRLTGRFHTQSGAFFWREVFGIPNYPTGGYKGENEEEQRLCRASDGCYTGDAKLSPFRSAYLEGRVALDLGFLDREGVPLGRWLGGGVVSVTAGRYNNNAYAWRQFGNAWVGGLEIVLPL